jgi:hypothetical protein
MQDMQLLEVDRRLERIERLLARSRRRGAKRTYRPS